MTSFAASWDTGDGPFCPTCDKGTGVLSSNDQREPSPVTRGRGYCHQMTSVNRPWWSIICWERKEPSLKT